MNKENNINYLDAFKGIAVLAVLMIHTGGGTLPGIIGKIGNDGARGVQLFFLISGFLTFKSLHSHFPDRITKMTKVLTWYRSKLFRLIPLYYLALFLTIITGTYNTWWLGVEENVTIPNIMAHFLFLHGLFPHYANSILGIEWYIGVLVLFLLVSPVLYRFIDSLESSIIFVIAVYIANPFLSKVLEILFPIEKDSTIYGYYLSEIGPISQLLVFSLGIVLYYVISRLTESPLPHNTLLSYSLLILSITMLYGRVNGEGFLYRLTTNEFYSVWLFILIMSQSLHSSPIISNPFFRVLGRYSYGIYLFQFLWINFYDKYINYTGIMDWTVKFIASILALLAISYLLTRFVDRPIQERLQRLNKL